MYFKHLALILFLSFALISCAAKKSDESLLKPYDTSKLLAGKLSYKAPEAWTKRAPINEMRLDEYVIDASTNTVASVYFFQGMRDALDANLSRWGKQFKDDAARGVTQTEQYNKQGLPITIYHTSGTYLEKLEPMNPQSPTTEMQDYALLAAVVEMSDGTWFFKILGPKASVEASREGLDQLINSLKVE